MRYLKLVWVVLTLALVPTASTYKGQPSSPSTAPNRTEQPLSLRVVSYQIEARLDVAKKAIDATETLTYRNLTGRALDTFPFHLYLNAFQPTLHVYARGAPLRDAGEDPWLGLGS
jgi:hypothetical protein